MSFPFLHKQDLPQYVHYIAPSMFAFTIASVFGIVDGLFVGNVVGDAGLAAISVAWPIVQLALAMGTGIGMGGSVIASIRLGEGDASASARAMGTTLTLLFACSIPLCVVFLLAGPWLMGPLGASGETFVQAGYYIRAVSWGIPFYVVLMGSFPLLRNRGLVKTAMSISIVSGLVNVVLDYLFVVVFEWGTAGAAWATVLGQLFGFVWVMCIFCMRKHREVLKNLRPDFAIARHAVVLGIAPFGLSILPEVSVIVTNINANSVGGEQAVAAFAVISYVVTIVQMMIQGVGDGSQPMISLHRGEGDFEKVKRIRRTNYAVTMVISVVALALMTAFRYQIPQMFGASAETVEIISFALPVYCVSFVLYAFTHPVISFFYAIDFSRASNMMVYGEAILVVILITLMAQVFGLRGLWFSPTAVQLCLSCLAVWNLRKCSRMLSAEAAASGKGKPAIQDGR